MPVEFNVVDGVAGGEGVAVLGEGVLGECEVVESSFTPDPDGVAAVSYLILRSVECPTPALGQGSSRWSS